MKKDTRDLGMVATVWVTAAIAVLALGRVDVPAGLIAGHDDGGSSVRSIDAAEPPPVAVADPVPSAEAVPLIHLPADEMDPGSEPRGSVSLAERHPWPTAAARAASMDGGPTSGHDATTHPRAGNGPPKPEPEPTEAKPEPTEAKPKPTEAKPEPKPTEAKPKPKPTEPEPAKPGLAQPKPGQPRDPAHKNAPDA